jgi:hypothetical protein
MQEKKLEEISEVPEEKEILDFNNPTFKFIPSGNHEWKQRGYYLICLSCELEHAIFIGPDKILVGIDDKGPILKLRKDLGMA